MEHQDHVLERHETDAGKPVLMLLGWRYGIEDSPRFVEKVAGRYVKLTKAGQRELERANKLRR